MRKKTNVALIALCLSAAMSVPAFAAGWVKNNDAWYYTDRDGEYITNEWKISGNNSFYLGDDGEMVTGSLIEDDGDYYYVNESGARVKNEWRLLYDADEGEEYWYYFGSNGKARESGYQTIDGVRYHFSNYHLDLGWQDGDDGDYYFGEDASNYKAGWHYIDNFNDDDRDEGWYYTDKSGKVVKDQEKKIGGYYYAFNADGLMCDGWVNIHDDGKDIAKFYRIGNGDRMNGWYYFDGDSSYDNSAIEHEEGWYYLKNGQPYSTDYKTTKISDEYGVVKINSKYYCFDQNGLMQYGIVKGNDGTLYYFGSPDDGAMKTGRVKVEYDDRYDYEDQTMYFNTSGAIGVKGSDFTGVKSNYLYENGELVTSDDGYELVTVGNLQYVVNENGKIKTSGTITDDDDVRWRVEKAENGGYKLVRVE